MNPVGDLNINIIHKKSIPSIAKLISTIPDSNVKKCRLCEKKSPDICSYEDEVLYQHFTWKKLLVRSSVVYYVSVSCCNDDNSEPHGGGGV